jgi:D-sedoheptulose 7-phosphate isomerase
MNVRIFDELVKRYPRLEDRHESITALTEGIINTFANGGKLLVCGNGGSAADADHIVGELMKGFERRRPVPDKFFTGEEPFTNQAEMEYMQTHLQRGLPAINLSCHISFTSAFSNDAAPDLVFAQGVFGYGKADDALLCLSTSGNSKNTVYAAIMGKLKNLRVYALTGPADSRLSELSRETVQAPGNSTAEIQEYHLPIYHAVCRCIEDYFFPD